jgi:L-glyceraldehyde 3-phosphate reductase
MNEQSNSYLASEDRYAEMPYRRCGRSGLKLPEISIGLWQNFGDGADVMPNARAMLRRAFDLGITHVDLANNYGPPPGSAETTFGILLKQDFHSHRDELVISTKAGYRMWPGPYGEFGSRKYLLASLDQSLKRMGLEYVDILYSHRYDPETPLEETMGALAHAVRCGKALYAGISNYPPEAARAASQLLRHMGAPCLIHQAKYSMVERWVEGGLTQVLSEEGMGLIAFSPLAQGILTDKYLDGIPAGTRAAQTDSTLRWERFNPEVVAQVRALSHIAASRGQTMAQMAIAWLLRLPTVTSVLIGASRVSQIDDCVGAIRNTTFRHDEVAEIDRILHNHGP